MRCARQQRGEDSQAGDEARSQNRLIAMPFKERLEHRQSFRSESSIAPVAQKRPAAELAPDEVACVVAEHRPNTRDCHHYLEMKVPERCEESRSQQNRLSGHRDSGVPGRSQGLELGDGDRSLVPVPVLGG